MNMRRRFLGMMAALIPASLLADEHTAAKPSQQLCIQHEFVSGPFYLTAAVSYEEPQFYPPSGLVKPEFCKNCGVLRIAGGNAEKFSGIANLWQGGNR